MTSFPIVIQTIYIMQCNNDLCTSIHRRQEMQTVCASSMHAAPQLTSTHAQQHTPQRPQQQTISAPSERAPPPPPPTAAHQIIGEDTSTPHRLKSAPEEYGRRRDLQSSCPLERPHPARHRLNSQKRPQITDATEKDQPGLADTAPAYTRNLDEAPVKYGELIIVGLVLPRWLYYKLHNPVK